MDFFTFIWCKKCNVFLEKTKVNKEEAEDAYFFEKNDCLVYRNGSSLSSSHCCGIACSALWLAKPKMPKNSRSTLGMELFSNRIR